ncbi:hypothetical protein H072_1746 [Dactylellina haptotyla CBS 200.50]|uniref:Uncharacterized protein n=1 Tax=Dactylellina haptotyla (strain CBS 200.50) TaxID=1284197 RepID=S8AMX7_DACHA|nr:hypothetical protein H072_1746 [Dactylellina haptotyla CBS 200.50]
MKNVVSLLAFAAAASIVQAACNADNCARAVTGTNAKPASATRMADCSSFFQITVTPATSTITVWETVTPFTVTPETVTETVVVSTATEYDYVATVTTYVANTVVKRGLVRRAVTQSPSVVPTYASLCSGTSRYSSACSCWGVTKVTINAPTPLTTVTSTESATATVTATVTKSETTTVVVETTSVVVATCEGPFYALCSGSCKHIRSDANNCGSCGNVCSSGTCVNGVCAASAEECPVTHNCQGGSIYPACSGRSSYPSSPFCLCFQTFDNLRFCTDGASRPCSAVPACNTHDDCGLGEVCIVHGCCNNGNKYCRPTGAAVCRAPSTPTRLFRLRNRRSDAVDGAVIDGSTELGYVSQD